MKYLLIICCCVLGIVWWCSYSSSLSSSWDNSVSTVCNRDHCIDVEIADTEQLRERGLMYRESLPSQSGMLFVFDQSYPHGFWMKNTLIPLDMIWIDQNKTVVDVQTAIPCVSDPCQSYIPWQSAIYVLEMNGGGAERYDIKTGDVLDIIYEEKKK